MINFLSIYWLLVFLQAGNPWIPIGTIEVNANKIAIDHLQNIYAVSQNQFIKYDKKGKLMSSYATGYSGDITSVDISDPMRILLFYDDYQQLIFLDNTLSVLRSPVLVDELKTGVAKLACTSASGGFWIYSEQNQQLARFNANLQLEQKSVNISAINPISSTPNFLIEKNELVYLNIPETGILIFDIFGFYIKTIPVKQLQSFQVDGDELFYTLGNKLIIFNQVKLSFDTVTVSSMPYIKDIKISKDIALTLIENEIQILKMK